MKLFCHAALMIMLSGHVLAEAGITVTEKRLPNGDSEIVVDNTISKVKRTYAIVLSTHHHPATRADHALVRTYTSWEFGAFLCYNSNQYSGSEFCTSENPVVDFRPSDPDIGQWIRTIKQAGMRYAVLTVRHTSEFLLWDSATSEIKVTNGVYGKDLVKEYVDECRKADIVPGFYYCLWGNRWRPNPNARAIILAQLHELATRYGKIPYFWLDMPHCTGWLAGDLSQQEIYDALKNINPDGIVMFNNTIQDGRVLKAFPTDVINGEMCSPPPDGHNPWRSVDGRKYFIPFEYEPCSQQRGNHVNGQWDFPGAAWFTYGAGMGFESSRPLSAEFLYRRIRVARDRGATNVLLACAPDHTGQFRADDSAQLIRLGQMLKNPSLAPPMPITYRGTASASGDWSADYTADKAFDGSPTTRWGGPEKSKAGWLAVELVEPGQFSQVTISEGWDRVRRFELQIEDDGQWRTILRGTTIGADYSAAFEPVTARKVRLNILEAVDVPTIWEVGLSDLKR